MSATQTSDDRRDVLPAAVTGLDKQGASLAFLLAALTYLFVPLIGGPRLEYDSYTYLQMARALTGAAEGPIGFEYLSAGAPLQTTFPMGLVGLLALFGRLGAPLAAVAVWLSAVAYLATVTMAFVLVRPRAPRWIALLTASLVAVSYPVVDVAWTGTSESVALATMFAALVALDRAEASQRWVPWVLAGLLAGATVWVRYAMLPFVVAFVMGVVAVAVVRRRRDACAAMGVVTALTAVVGLFVFNLSTSGAVFGPHRPPSSRSFVANLTAVFNHVIGSTTGHFASRESMASLLATLVLAGLCAAVAVLAARTIIGKWSCNWMAVSWLMLLSYPAFLVISSTLVEYDAVERRFMSVWIALVAPAVLAPVLLRSGRRWGVALAAAFVVGQLIAGWGTADVGTRAPWRWGDHERDLRRQFARVLERAEQPGAVLLTNSKKVLYVYRGALGVFVGDDLHWHPSRLDTGAPLREDVARARWLLYVRHDHPAFDASRLGDVVESLMRGGASSIATVRFDDGHGRLFERVER